MAEISRHRQLTGFWHYALLTAAFLSIGLSAYQLFSIGRLMSDSDFLGGIP